MAKAKTKTKAVKNYGKVDLIDTQRLQRLGLDKYRGLNVSPNMRWRRLMTLFRVEWKKVCPSDSAAPSILWLLDQITKWDPKAKAPSGPVPDAGTVAGDYFDKLDGAFAKRSRGWQKLNSEDDALNSRAKVKFGKSLMRLMSASADDEGKTQAAQVVVENTNELDGP